MLNNNNNFWINWAENASNVPSRMVTSLLRTESIQNAVNDSDASIETNLKLDVDKLFSRKLSQMVTCDETSEMILNVKKIRTMMFTDAVSQIFTFLNTKEIAMFSLISKETKFIMNQFYLRHCNWMVNKRNDGVYVLKCIHNFDDMNNINIDTLTWSHKYNGNENWDIIHNIGNTKKDDIWYLLSDYWFNNKNFGWGTFERSNSIHKMNGEWKILNNPNVIDNVFYFDVRELNAILSMLRHPLLRDNYHKNVKIVFDQRNNVKSKINGKMFIPSHFCITYWTNGCNNNNPFRTSGIKISGRKIGNNNDKENDVGLINEEILYCNFLTNMYYGDKLKWKWYNNDTFEYIQYSMDNKHLINQLECNYQSSKLFTSTDRQLISLTCLSEFKKWIKQRITPKDDINIAEEKNYFKFRCFRSKCGQLSMIQVSIKK